MNVLSKRTQNVMFVTQLFLECMTVLNYFVRCIICMFGRSPNHTPKVSDTRENSIKAYKYDCKM